MKFKHISIFLMVLLINSCGNQDDTVDEFSFNSIQVIDSSLSKLPSIRTERALFIDFRSVIVRADIFDDNSILIQDKGFCWSEAPSPIIEDKSISLGPGAGVFETNIEKLNSGQDYYIRSFALNQYGIKYGNEIKVSTVPDSLMDIDGNYYKLTKIGKDFWFRSNLKTSHFSNGDSIRNIRDQQLWIETAEPASCDYNNEIASSRLGKLYNYMVVEDERNVCPEGFHVSTPEDWINLKDTVNKIFNEFGGNVFERECYHLRENNTDYWIFMGYSTNKTKFSARGSGFRNLDSGSFLNAYEDVYQVGSWWLQDDSYKIYNSGQLAKIYSNSDKIYFENNYENYGLSIRCVKDQIVVNE